ncbi:MAG: ABC transporter substrate-binding protein [Gulosibacter sp.]|uniref:ABC transporter substrate-binding protein n=1 Tax=Gulosibacter sp. TaxID=2817531 RepID=UPI003F90B402
MNNRGRMAAGAVLAVAAMVALTGCQSGSSDAAEGGTDSITIIHAPVNYEVAYIAQQEGFFDEVGLDVTINPGGTPQDNLAQAMGGSADLTIVAWDTLVTASAESIPALAVASAGVVAEDYDTSGIIVRADSDIESVADLVDKQIAFSDLGGGPHIVAQQAFIEAGLDASQLNAVKIPFASMQASLENGQVDAVFPSDSFYSQMASNPDFEVIANPTREFRSGLPITLWAATEQWLLENPETAEKFVRAMELATEFYNDPANHDAIIDIRMEVSEISVEQAEAMQTEFSVPIPLGVTQSVSDALIELGAVENADSVPASEDLIWDQAITTE